MNHLNRRDFCKTGLSAALGFDMGLGEIREDSIEIVGETLGNLQSRWKPARLMG